MDGPAARMIWLESPATAAVISWRPARRLATSGLRAAGDERDTRYHRRWDAGAHEARRLFYISSVCLAPC